MVEIFSKKNKETVVCCGIYIFLVIRIMFLILAKPYIGIANNGDFERLMAPLGIKYAENPWIMDELYHDTFFGWVTNDNYVFCVPENNGWHQTYALFSNLAILLSNRINNGYFDIRSIGLINALLYFVALFCVFYLINKIQGRNKYFYLILVSFVLSDSYILQYFNSFYTEPGAVIFCLLTLCLQIYGFLFLEEKETKRKILFFLIYFLSVFFEVTCKQQDILVIVPALFVSFALFHKLKIRRIWSAIWTIFLLSFILIVFKVNVAGGNITAFNVTNGDILANSKCPEKRLSELNFSEEEIELIMTGLGDSAFSLPYDWSIFEDKFDRKTELKIMCEEPSIFFRMLNKRSRNLFVDSPLGNFTKDSGAVWGEKTEANRLWYKFKNTIYGHSLAFYGGVIIVALIFALVGFSGHLFFPLPKELFMILGMTTISNVLRFFSVIVGDGSFDDIKHFFTINVEFDLIFLSTFFCILFTIKRIIIKWINCNKVKSFFSIHKSVALSLRVVRFFFLAFIIFLLIRYKMNEIIGSSFDTMRRIEGVYSDGWFEKEGSFLIRTEKEGMISMTFYNPNEINDMDEIVVYINGKESYRDNPKDHIISMSLRGKVGRVNRIKVVTSIKQKENEDNGDSRQLSLLMTEIVAK